VGYCMAMPDGVSAGAEGPSGLQGASWAPEGEQIAYLGTI
jgi:hypothetical protein